MQNLPHIDDLPTVAIVGRVNAGKSTLFNHITDSGHAIVSSRAGTTRTRNTGVARWRGNLFRIVDTGGLTFDKTDDFEKDVRQQFEKALDEATLVIFLVDVTTEPTVAEQELGKKLRQSKIPTILVANKADTNVIAVRASDPTWRKFGLGEPTPISASTGRGIGDLLDTIVSHDAFVAANGGAESLRNVSKKEDLIPPGTIKVALIGKPNVGKSSLFNALIGEDRVIVSNIPHTTRETHDTLFTFNNQNYLFIDTAGIRKKRNIDDSLEKTGVHQSLSIIEEADVVLFVIDASTPLSHQDKALAGFIQEKNKPLIIVANKWDLISLNQAHVPAHVQKDDDEETKFRKYLDYNFRYISFAPIIFVSAKDNLNVTQLFPLVSEVNAARTKKIDPLELETAFRAMIKRHLPTKGKGVRHPKIYSIKQIAFGPPVFELAVRRKTDLHESYMRYLEKHIRSQFGFIGVPMVFYVKKVMV